jgi:hypothetical protein
MITLDELYSAHLPLSEFMLLLPGIDKKDVRNWTDRELLRWSIPRRDYSGPRFYSLFNALEALMLDRLSKAGSRLPVAKLIAAAAALRFKQRIEERTLGTDSDLRVMIYTVTTRDDGPGAEKTQLTPKFVLIDDVAKHLPGGGSLRLQDRTSIETRILPIDEVIEDLFRLYTMAERDGRIGAES